MKAVKTGHNRAASTPYPDGAKCAAKLPIGYEWPPFFGRPVAGVDDLHGLLGERGLRKGLEGDLVLTALQR